MIISLDKLPNILEHIIKALKSTNVNKPAILLNGATGIGKTATIQDIAKKLNYELIDFRLARELPENIGGIPYLNGDENYFVKKLHIKFKIAFEKPTILLLDEFNRSNSYTRNAIMSIIYERELEGKKLHPESIVILAVNTGAEYTDVEEIDKALLARCLIINVVPTKFSKEMISFFSNNFSSSPLILTREREITQLMEKDLVELIPPKTFRSLQNAQIILDYCLSNQIEKEIMDILLLAAVHPDIYTILQTSLLKMEILEKIINGEKVDIPEQELYPVLTMAAAYPFTNSNQVINLTKFSLNQLEKLSKNKNQNYIDIIIPILKIIKERNERFYLEMLTKEPELTNKLIEIISRISKK